MRKSLFLILISYSLSIFSFEFSVMTLNAQNLFDTIDDPKKNDKAYLPIELKQSKKHINSCNTIRVKSWKDECLNLDWDEKTKNTKLHNLAAEILKYDNSGPDILALQEVENSNILSQLFNLLEPHGYKNFALVEGDDYRGIDNAIISKFNIIDTKLHYISFTGDNEDKDTRPIMESTLIVNDKKLKIYNVHFPAGYHPVSMRIDSLNTLRSLLDDHQYPTIALGDFNINQKEDSQLGIYASQEKSWSIAHLVGCDDCKGTHYYSYGNSWSFLDTIFLSHHRGVSFIPDSITVHVTETNSYSEFQKPKRFDPITGKGVSDHFPVVAKLIFD